MTRKLTFTFTFLAACASDHEDPEMAVERGTLSHTQLSGSCFESDCDGQAPDGNCWCDDLCVEFGDCCSDRVDVCEAPVAPACGGLAGLRCDEGFYCEYSPDAMCGFADQTGVCRELPSTCTAAFAPVCGCNGETFGNACEAAMAGVSVASEGACAEESSQACGGLLGQTCPANSFCNFEPADACGAADAPGTCQPMPEACIQIYQPVCGCDDRTYDNECEANVAGVAIAAAGPCGA